MHLIDIAGIGRKAGMLRGNSDGLLGIGRGHLRRETSKRNYRGCGKHVTGNVFHNDFPPWLTAGSTLHSDTNPPVRGMPGLHRNHR